MKIAVLGDGGWGTTLAILLHNNGHQVTLWGAFKDYVEVMKKTRFNQKFLKGIKIPSKLQITSSLEEILKNNQYVIFAIPSKYLRGVLKQIKNSNITLGDKSFLSVIKGIENKSLKRMSEVIKEELGNVSLAVLSGPNIALEIAHGLPAVSVVASENHELAKSFQKLLISKTFRVYTNTDVIGIELGGSLKNVIAISCGICDGMGFGSNAKAAILTRGLAEISRLGAAMGAKRETFFGISGLGDLVTTCTSSYSRNRSIGEQIGQGKSLIEITKNMEMVAEGIETAKAGYLLSKKYNIEMPITQEVYRILFKNKSPQKVVKDLMLRKEKKE